MFAFSMLLLTLFCASTLCARAPGGGGLSEEERSWLQRQVCDAFVSVDDVAVFFSFLFFGFQDSVFHCISLT